MSWTALQGSHGLANFDEVQRSSLDRVFAGMTHEYHEQATSDVKAGGLIRLAARQLIQLFPQTSQLGM